MKRSTGLRNYMLSTGSFKGAMDGSVIKIYSGSQPLSADDPLSVGSVLLCTISVNGSGTGLTMSPAAANGQLSKNTGEVWSGTVAANGTAAFFRMETTADDGTSSTTAIRLQGSIGLDGADLNFATVSLVIGNLRQINFFVVSIVAG